MPAVPIILSARVVGINSSIGIFSQTVAGCQHRTAAGVAGICAPAGRPVRPCSIWLDLARLGLAPYPLRLSRSRSTARTPDQSACAITARTVACPGTSIVVTPSGGFARFARRRNVENRTGGGQVNRWTGCQRWTGGHRHEIRSGWW